MTDHNGVGVVSCIISVDFLLQLELLTTWYHIIFEDLKRGQMYLSKQE
ncbi:unnamed protein product [Rhodiola kirilowii]